MQLACSAAGYSPTGTNTATCNLPGLWSTNFSCCQTCSPVYGPNHITPNEESHRGICEGESITLNAGELKLTCFKCADDDDDDEIMEWHLAGCQDTRLKFYQTHPEYLYLPTIGLLLLAVFVLSGVVLKLRRKLSHKILSADMIKIKSVRESTIFRTKLRRPNRVSSESSDDFRTKSPRRVINIPICSFSSTSTAGNNSRRFSEVSF